MPSCAFIDCKNHSKRKNKSHGISFHSFPGDELLLHKWLIITRKQRQEPNWTPNIHSHLCSVHFKSQDIYTTKKGYRRLSKSAVPFFQPAKVAANLPSPNSLNNVNISDLDLIVDSPRQAYLKRRLCTEQMKKKELMRDNKNLKNKIKRLIKAYRNLKEALSLSKTKLYKQIGLRYVSTNSVTN